MALNSILGDTARLYDERGIIPIHGDDPWQKKELAASYLAVYATLMPTGAGRFSLDQRLWGGKIEATADSSE